MVKKIITCALFICLCFSFASAQKTSGELKDRKITLKLQNKSLEEVFFNLIVKYDVPIGMEGSTLDNEHLDYMFKANIPDDKPLLSQVDGSFETQKHWFTIKVKDASLEEVLNQIVRQMTNYRWEINDGVVNIIPIKGRDSRYEKLLATTVNNFSFEKNSPVGVIRNNIFKLPEIQTFLIENKLYSTDYRGLLQNIGRKIPEGMNFSNMTFRELLNKITKVKRGGWILRKNYLFGSKEKEYIEIDI